MKKLSLLTLLLAASITLVGCGQPDTPVEIAPTVTPPVTHTTPATEEPVIEIQVGDKKVLGTAEMQALINKAIQEIDAELAADAKDEVIVIDTETETSATENQTTEATAPSKEINEKEVTDDSPSE